MRDSRHLEPEKVVRCGGRAAEGSSISPKTLLLQGKLLEIWVRSAGLVLAQQTFGRSAHQVVIQ